MQLVYFRTLELYFASLSSTCLRGDDGYGAGADAPPAVHPVQCVLVVLVAVQRVVRRHDDQRHAHQQVTHCKHRRSLLVFRRFYFMCARICKSHLHFI